MMQKVTTIDMDMDMWLDGGLLHQSLSELYMTPKIKEEQVKMVRITAYLYLHMGIMQKKSEQNKTLAQNQSELLTQTQTEQLKEDLALQQQNNSDQEAQLNALRVKCQEKVDSLEESQLKLKQVRYNNVSAEQIITLQNQIKKLEEESNKLVMKELHFQSEFDEERQKLGAITQQREDLAGQRGALYQEKEALYQEMCKLKTNLERRD
ncbi:uncharacterized protein [Ambystoma mexicanum]|uniref:uncharacterized protein n=1 Tax=Ambystoma mexicanum TaxID=8296 RepID=UPI0037E7756C